MRTICRNPAHPSLFSVWLRRAKANLTELSAWVQPRSLPDSPNQQNESNFSTVYFYRRSRRSFLSRSGQLCTHIESPLAACNLAVDRRVPVSLRLVRDGRGSGYPRSASPEQLARPASRRLVNVFRISGSYSARQGSDESAQSQLAGRAVRFFLPGDRKS